MTTNDPVVQVTRTSISIGGTIISTRNLSTVSVQTSRGSVAVVYLGFLVVFFGLMFGSCAALVADVTGDMKGIMIAAACIAGGLALVYLARFIGRTTYTVLARVGGADVAVARTHDAAWAQRVSDAIAAAIR